MILRGIGKVPPPAMPVCHGSTVHKLASYPGHTQVQCFKCLRWGHIAQMCHAPPARQHFGCGHVRQKSLPPQSTVLHIVLPLFYPLSSLMFERPALSLNFGPCLKLGINKGVVPLLLVCFCIFIYISSPFSLYGPVSFYFKISGLAPPSEEDLPFCWFPPFAFALTISMVLQVTITNQREQTLFIHDSRLTPAELRERLVILNEVNTSGEPNKLRTQLKETERWHA